MSAAASFLDNPWWGWEDNGGPPEKAVLFFGEPVGWALEYFLQHNGVFVSGIDGRRTHCDSYMTCVEFTALEAALQLLEAQYCPTAEDWEPVVRHWAHGDNMQPPLRIVGRLVAHRYKIAL